MFPFFSNHGVLGLNARNLLYIKPFNPRKAVAFADDKMKTKAYLSARDIPVAKTFARIDDHAQLRSFDFSQLPDECVLKPNYGFGGGGILILKGRDDAGNFLEQGKKPISTERLREHIEDILDGKFSVNGLPAGAFFEKILVPDRSFAPFRPAGLPDIRIVVFNLVPVMAMLRIPTAESGGKANVHMGGIGIGIDIAKGVTTHATQYNKLVRELPHGGSPSGIAVPRWEELLLIASRIQYVTNIGYLAVDLTIDEELGPVLLEVNARAGLMVQVANLAPLRSRLERVAGLKVPSPEKGVSLAQDLFGAKAKKETDDAEEKKVLSLRETIVVTAGAGMNVDVPSLISPDHERTIFDPSLMKQLAKAEALERESESDRTWRVKFTLGGKKIQTVVREEAVADAGVRAIIGRRDLGGFLLDPSKAPETPALFSTVKEDLRAVDNMLSAADENLLVLKHVKPMNVHEEREKAKLDPLYEPIFIYEEPGIDLDDLEDRLLHLRIDDRPAGVLFKKKRRELLRRISLIRGRGDARRFTEASAALYGMPTAVLLTTASAALKAARPGTDTDDGNDVIDADATAAVFEEALARYGLHDWSVVVREHTIARCTVGGRKVTLRKDAKFSRAFLPALIAHEVETHVLTAENGAHQPYELFRRGFAGYLDTQEGLAVYNQNRFLSPNHEKRFGPARNVLGTAFALEHGFAETRRHLVEEVGYDPEKALNKTIEFKRGIANTAEAGAFTKGLAYWRGLRAIEQFAEQGGDLARLYTGKIAMEDLDLIESIPGVKPPLVLPTFLRETPPDAEKNKRGVRKKK